jgi:6,7-dimethyl-8-ribityllumazine synthase
MADVKSSKLHNDTGILHVEDACILLVKTEWNADIVDELERGCIGELQRQGIKKIIISTVPGSFEIPFAIRKFWENAKKKNRPNVIIALGCVLRGGTPHFDYICKAVTDGILQLNLILPVPVVFGVLTVDHIEQARERIGGQHGHKGIEAAITAIKMISLKTRSAPTRK